MGLSEKELNVLGKIVDLAELTLTMPTTQEELQNLLWQAFEKGQEFESRRVKPVVMPNEVLAGGNRPKIITIIGSTRFINEMSLIGWEFEKQGHIVLNPRLLPSNYKRKTDDDDRHAAESEGVKEIIDKTYLYKVAMADEIFVVNINGYIGESTQNELNYAIRLNKKIIYYENESQREA